MSKIYEEILASIMKKKFVESLNGDFIVAFQTGAGSITPENKHKLLYAIAKYYAPDPKCGMKAYNSPLRELDEVIAVLQGLQKLAGADFNYGGAHPELIEYAYTIALNDKTIELVEIGSASTDLAARIIRLYKGLNLTFENPHKQEPSAATPVNTYLPSGGASLAGLGNTAAATATTATNAASASYDAKAMK